ncbi:MAG: hypothetical protein N3E45_13975 [Oscillatoriaceae bacterium SKW80]|nr:hypothetical protein [Oscillatoriaceae bacterium SKYG93]MCX8121907.1 hypothetical protein [Oscillatoriaceae bacterium SKW80]MDW8454668.1 hypothetical protein [Oscillatoriaceae cyanobacterium SKYGB_i_bin93]HIK28627.1 hypothetical protein [Oscillatoriaceae cyanobacterium M7585_C2015_266]
MKSFKHISERLLQYLPEELQRFSQKLDYSATNHSFSAFVSAQLKQCIRV